MQNTSIFVYFNFDVKFAKKEAYRTDKWNILETF